MRVEPSGVGSIVHVTNRGVRGMDIVRDVADRDNFVRSLFYLNDTHADRNWRREIAHVGHLERPVSWPERDPLVRILAWTLLPNHFHILAQEIREGGVAKLQQRLAGSVSMTFNKKYGQKGALFQSSYYARTVVGDDHLRYLAFYILIKNVLDVYPGGLTSAQSDFDRAWEWAKRYPYSGFRSIISGEGSVLLDDPDELMTNFLGSGDAFKEEARELLAFHTIARGGDFEASMLEPWD